MTWYNIIIDILIYIGILFCFYNVILGLTKGEVIGRGFIRHSKKGSSRELSRYNYLFYKYLITGVFITIIMIIIKN